MQTNQTGVKSGVPGFALWNLGFRPFYLLASLFSAISILLWAIQYSGYLPFAYLQGPVWHGHEMIFGYTIAVIAGFLLTAVRVWTNQPTPSKPKVKSQIKDYLVSVKEKDHLQTQTSIPMIPPSFPARSKSYLES